DGAERADAADADHLEGDVLEHISIEETKPVRRQAALISGERALGIEVVAGVPLAREMIDERRPVLDARRLALYQMGKVVILCEVVASFGEDASQLTPERTMLDELDLGRELDFAVPDFQRRTLCQAAHPAAIRLDRGRCDRPRPLFREVRRQSS